MNLNSASHSVFDNKENKNWKTVRKEHPSCAQNAKHYFVDFCDKTGLHGFNLLGEGKRTWQEKIWWFIIILAAFSLCIAMIVQTTKRWINFPVTVTFSTSQTYIHEVPFPAVTICPDSKTDTDYFNYTKVFLKKSNHQELAPEEESGFEYLSLVCNSPSEYFNESHKFTNVSAIDFLKEVAPSYAYSLYEVEWLGESYENENIADLFTPILTSEGICYTFNIMDRSEIFTDLAAPYDDFFSTNGKTSEWSLDKGYSKNSGLETYPRRTLAAGLGKGLSMYFYVHHANLDYACGDSSQGFKVILHNPASIPRAKQDYFRVPLDQAVVGAIKPKIFTTSEDLVSYKPRERQCYFATERSLKYFRIYNQANCLNECLMNSTLKTCGCLGFHMPKENSTRICGPAKLQCMEEVKGTFVENEVNFLKLHSYERSNDNRCNCLPSCSSLDYSVQLSQSDWEWKETMRVQKHTPTWDSVTDEDFFENAHFSVLHLFFKDMQFTTSERNELYSQIDYWANIGGVLGLFTGFTFISACEVFYYLTLRLGCNIRKFGRHYWSGSEKLLSRNGNSAK